MRKIKQPVRYYCQMFSHKGEPIDQLEQIDTPQWANVECEYKRTTDKGGVAVVPIRGLGYQAYVKSDPATLPTMRKVIAGVIERRVNEATS